MPLYFVRVSFFKESRMLGVRNVVSFILKIKFNYLVIAYPSKEREVINILLLK